MSDNRSIIIVGLVSALILCGGAAAVIAFNDTNNNASDVSDAYSNSNSSKLFIESSNYTVQDDSLTLGLEHVRAEAKGAKVFESFLGAEISSVDCQLTELTYGYGK